MLSISKSDNVEDFLEELDSINERLKARKKKFNGSKVRIATVHEFKGKEADSVYVWNDSVDIFPHKDCDLEDEEELEEERRVHYIACTRARKINTILYVKNKPGMFLQEMDLSNAENISKVEKVGGDLKQPKPSKYMSIEDLFEDEDYVLPSSGRVIKVSASDYAEILKMYRDEGMSVEEIFGHLEENGYDLYTFSQIKEIIDEYEREINLRGK